MAEEKKKEMILDIEDVKEKKEMISYRDEKKGITLEIFSSKYDAYEIANLMLDLKEKLKEQNENKGQNENTPKGYLK